ncbi:MAG: ABC transporter permease [Sphingobacteriales bacterium]|nr:ABC transporter permease [Sphingobacteriales bacterium]MBI3717480.1 ABC transporter permease [Sphingobacteriales bacterium]
MNKIWLIIKREYITRVRNKSFLLSTFLLPIVMILFIFGSVFIAVSTKTKAKVAVANDPGYFKNSIKSDSSSISFDFTPGVDSLNYAGKGFDAVLYIPNGTSNNYAIYSQKQLGLETEARITDKLNKAIENNLLQQKGIHKETLDSISKQTKDAVELNNRVLDENGKAKEANAGLAYGIAFGSGILIYITMIVFGAMVMRGVMEEKTNRIAEVIISSVKPFQLMIGKIVGIAGVGLTQFLLWIILIFTLSSIAGAFIPHELLEQANQVNSQVPGGMQNNTAALKFLEFKGILGTANWGLILGCFFFYFLCGYLFYSSLFAAVGSVVEDAQESQQLMFPIMMPIIFAFIILSSGINDPNSKLMFWGSMIPFTSPIIMMGRIPFGVPWWQLGLSMILLVAGFLFTTWMAGKIYRTGILLYGKKVNWKEMLKWAFKKS